MFGNILDLVASIYTVTLCRLHRIFSSLATTPPEKFVIIWGIYLRKIRLLLASPSSSDGIYSG